MRVAKSSPATGLTLRETIRLETKTTDDRLYPGLSGRREGITPA